MTPFTVVLLAVALQVAGALVLKTLADMADPRAVLLAGGVALVALLNGMRFLAWGYAHRRYPLSTTYPLASTFFPLMAVIAYLYGEQVQGHQLAGAALITTGVAWLAVRRRETQ